MGDPLLKIEKVADAIDYEEWNIPIEDSHEAGRESKAGALCKDEARGIC